jgi:hypothetical protein
MANTVGNKHDAAIARVWDFPLPLARWLALPLSREGVGIRLKNWTEAGNFWAVAEDYGSKFAALTFLLISKDSSIRSAATESPLASAIAFCSLRAFSR